MKNIKAFLLFFTCMILAGLSGVKAQKRTPDEIRKAVQSQNLVFKAEIAYPQGGNSRSLTSDYDLIITPNKAVSYLPYFGRTYTASLDPTEGGIKFNSTDFEYIPEQTSKGWSITIKPKDAREIQQLYLTVFENGTASLDVVSTNRQSISFSGYIK